MNGEPKKRRICEFCGQVTEKEYSDDEWEAAGYPCDECMDAELVDGTIAE